MHVALRPDHPQMGKYIYTFALIADTHLNHHEEESASPYACNRLANPRARWVVHDVNQWNPEFVVHLGDMINPVPQLATYPEAAECFRNIFSALSCPLYLIPGNHDIGDKPVDWMPAKQVHQEFIEQYRSVFGKDYHTFQHHDCHFVLINTSLLNSNLEQEAEQRAWLEDLQKKINGERVFLFAHYPPFIHSPTERGHYDNLDEPARSWLLKWVENTSVEAIFSAHVHNFFYNQHINTRLYVLPAVSFVRQDYSALFQVAPEREYGRDDIGKLGYCTIDIYEQGHICHPIRSYGQVLKRDEPIPTAAQHLPKIHTRTLTHSLSGVEIRKPWLEAMEIPAGGGVDEFERKMARNDYTVWALSEMGIQQLRISVSDLWTQSSRKRLRTLKEYGFSFRLYCFHQALSDVEAILNQEPDLIDALEIIAPLEELATVSEQCAALKNRLPIGFHFSPLTSDLDQTGDESQFLHGIFHGFRPDDSPGLREAIAKIDKADIFEGLVFSIFQNESPLETIFKACELLSETTLKPMCNVRLGPDHLFETVCNDHVTAARVAETLSAAWIDSGVELFLDTFEDFDRGYFVRSGLVDRSYNPRLPGRVFRHLTELSNMWPGIFDNAQRLLIDGMPVIRMTGPHHTGFLILPKSPEKSWCFPVEMAPPEGEMIDLKTGVQEKRNLKSGQPEIIQNPKFFLFEGQ
ncbi:MAG: metallophosphoesterase [Candidatus Latescibacteria bacterium]|nr:metallophosphoesterase [Candidatus Latescibacterota bacterium]